MGNDPSGKVRCAIYTRKSSEDGLAQDFNSLDAQREACAAYVASQASEGWELLSAHYDDGGVSGGTLERPSLQRLLSDVAKNRIDIVVVYKVDRLTRSLLDFAKLVEIFDAANVSFVSVTQAFNTTSSMGRLTLNMLLSFAQFEREITAERIRDKIAASKAKGMWMGGIAPLGYEPDGNNSLRIVEGHARLIRDIYRRYLSLKAVRLVFDELSAEGVTAPLRIKKDGGTIGGRSFTRGQLYQILKNPIYCGKIRHKKAIYEGRHQAIIDSDVWNNVQSILAENTRGQSANRKASSRFLGGLLFDESGEPWIPVHTSKPNSRRYRSVEKRFYYYVKRSVHFQKTGQRKSGKMPSRLPADELEQLVKKTVSQFLSDPIAVLSEVGLPLDCTSIERVRQSSEVLCNSLSNPEHYKLIRRVIIHLEHLEIILSLSVLSLLIGLGTNCNGRTTTSLTNDMRLVRNSNSLRLIDKRGEVMVSKVDPVLLNLLAQARVWWRQLEKGQMDIATLARKEKVTASYITRVVRLSFLSPKIIEKMLKGEQPSQMNGVTILAKGAIPMSWNDQEAIHSIA
ncbi:recombinase family protein [Altererythrobacter aurantiacus]|uniref:Recombinase family protein n=1 Tax=Parapontixanthobacter aurantiacus TaxID=1463599 RepID=A0A844ZJW4_9SPHN|nr:recombinase family protein [Parapontixanthobacter aurantiacus]MXO85989.1 recombinase family protein [Parapontixanthobacter aurantiacus]